MAALYEIAPRSAYRTDNNFIALKGGSRARTRLFYKNLEQ